MQIPTACSLFELWGCVNALLGLSIAACGVKKLFETQPPSCGDLPVYINNVSRTSIRGREWL
ncbi:MAG: hypothetical protein ACJA0G_002214 [Kangiellaceae bacterium]|jgi:hypothetical protein